MQGIIQFGRFIINVQWLVLAISGTLVYIVLPLRLKAVEPLNKVVQETLVDSLIIIGFVWKFSLIIFEPVKFVNNPLTLMYFSGGIRGFLLALVITATYLIYSSGKQGLSVWTYVDFITACFLAGTMIYNLIAAVLANQFLLFYGSRSLLAALLLLWQIKRFSPIGKPENLNKLLLWFSLGEILIFHFKVPKLTFNNLIWGFSQQQLLFYALATFAIVVNLISGRKSTNL